MRIRKTYEMRKQDVELSNLEEPIIRWPSKDPIIRITFSQIMQLIIWLIGASIGIPGVGSFIKFWFG